jgi:hypothetical protein
MKSKTFRMIAAMTLLGALAIPVRLKLRCEAGGVCHNAVMNDSNRHGSSCWILVHEPP